MAGPQGIPDCTGRRVHYVFTDGTKMGRERNGQMGKTQWTLSDLQDRSVGGIPTNLGREECVSSGDH